jgi:hypothetical protein
LNFKLIMNTATFAFGLYLAILGFGIGIKNGTAIAGSVLPVTLSIYVICLLLKSTANIASYIQVIYEVPESNIHWETDLSILKIAEGRYRSNRIILMWVCLTIIYSIMIVISTFFYVEYPSANIPLSYHIAVVAIEFIGFLIAIRMIRNIEREFELRIKFWENLNKDKITKS